MMIHPHLIAL